MLELSLALVADTVLNTFELIGMAESAGSMVGWAKNQYRGHKERDVAACQKLLYSLFLGAALDTLKERAKECEVELGRLSKPMKEAISKLLAGVDLRGYYAATAAKQDALVMEQYQEMFKGIEEIMREEVLPQRQVEMIFQDTAVLAGSACDVWQASLLDARSNFDKFDKWLSMGTEKSISYQIDSDIVFLQSAGADENVMHRAVKRCDYIAQQIEFSDGVRLDTRPQTDTSAANAWWWEKFSGRLAHTPLLLYGPGGMGKSAFLAYLYSCVKDDKTGCDPFSGAFLLSLDSIIQTIPEKYDYDDAPLTDPTKSLLLTRIASRSGNRNTSRRWDRALRTGVGLKTKKPVLLLLDGLNEMRQYSTDAGLYQYVLKEIAALSQFGFVRLIISSKVESQDENSQELNEQVEELRTVGLTVETVRLAGISRTLVQELAPELQEGSDMERMLHRPMYYNHMKKDENVRKIGLSENKYSMLKSMFHALSEQSRGNTFNDKERKFRMFIYEFFLPVFSYCVRNVSSNYKKALQESCKMMKQPINLCLLEDCFQGYDRELVCKFLGGKDIGSFLKCQEQILIIDTEGYISFIHQDYCDYLVAEYFLQRLTYIKKHLDQPFLDQDQGEQMNSLCLNTYNLDELRLIYQGINFSAEYVEYFEGGSQELMPEQITWERLIWYTTAYQLSDLRKLAKVAYTSERGLELDTLTVLKPILDYAKDETQDSNMESAFCQLEPTSLMLQNVVEILMKACALNRSVRQYEEALEIAKAANYICDGVQKIGRGEDAKIMRSVVDYNIARVYLREFMDENEPDDGLPNDKLAWSLEALYRGTQKPSPYRFSCSCLALMLVSPQPKLEQSNEYQSFKEKYFQNQSIKCAAFWMYLAAVYDARKQKESWLTRRYSLRQLLFLLAENKVQIIPNKKWDLDKADMEQVVRKYLRPRRFGDFLLREPVAGAVPIPTKDNLRLIKKFLSLIAQMEWPWKYYLEGLVQLYLEGASAKALGNFKAAYTLSEQTDFKAGLWYAFLSRDQKMLHDIFDRGKERTQVYKKSLKNLPDVNTYNFYAYYDRDFGSLYHVLAKELANDLEKRETSELPLPPAPSLDREFLDESLSKRVERELRLSQDEIAFVKEVYPQAALDIKTLCEDGRYWVTVSLHSHAGA